MAITCVLPDSVISVVDSGGNKFLFNNGSVYDSDTQWGLAVGTYKLINTFSSHPIAILNSGNSNISYSGDSASSFSKTVSGTTADGTYTFYYGNITITVTGNFGTLSYYCYNHGYMGGESKLVYSEACSSVAFPSPPVLTDLPTAPLSPYGHTKYTDVIFDPRLSTSASGTFTFSDKPIEGSTITLTDYESTSKVFEIDNEMDGASGSNIAVNGILAAGGGLAGTATDLVAKINSSSLKMTATNPSAGMVVLTQDSVGYAGNTSVSLNNSSHWNSSTSVNVPAALAGGATTPEPNIKTVRVASHAQGVGDFTTIQAWEDYADGQTHPFQWAECYDGGNLGTFTVDGWSSTPVATGYPRIFGAKQEYHDGNLNKGAFIQAAAGSVNTISLPYTRVERLRSTAGMHINLSSASNVLVKNCAVIADRGTNFKAKSEVSSVSSSGNLFYNCVSIGNTNPSGIINSGFEVGGESMINGLHDVKCINCTAYGHNNVGFRSYNGKLPGFNGGAHTAFVNCISASNSGSDFGFSDAGDGSGIFAPNIMTDYSNTHTYRYPVDDIVYINVSGYSENGIFKNPTSSVTSMNGVQGDFRLNGSYHGTFGYNSYTIPLDAAIAGTGVGIFKYSNNPLDNTNEGGFAYSVNGVQRGSFNLSVGESKFGDFGEAGVWDFGAYEYSPQRAPRTATFYIFGSGDFPKASGVSSLFTKGSVITTSNIDLYTKSNNEFTNSVQLFLKQERFRKNSTLFVRGSAAIAAATEDVDQYTSTSLSDSIINLSATAGGAGAGGGVGASTPASNKATLFITTSFPASGLSPLRKKKLNLLVVGVSDMYPKASQVGEGSYNRSLFFDSRGYVPFGESKTLFSKTESGCDVNSLNYKFNESAEDSSPPVTVTMTNLASGTLTKNNSYGNEITTVGNFNGVYTRKKPESYTFDNYPDDSLPYIYNNDENLFFANNFLFTGWTLYKRQENSSPKGDIDTETFSVLASHSGYNKTNNVNFTYASGYPSPVHVPVWSSGEQSSFAGVQDHDMIKSQQPSFTGGPISQFSSDATATFTFIDKPLETSTITLTDYESTSKTFEIDNEQNGASGSNIAVDGIAAAGGAVVGTSADLVAKINASSLKITATNPYPGKVILTQDGGETSGNTAITTNDSDHWNTTTSVNVPAAFTGGGSPVNFDLQGRPFAYIDRIAVNTYNEENNTTSTNFIEVGLINDSAIFLSKSLNGTVQDPNLSSGAENSMQHPHNSAFSSNGGIAISFWVNRLGYQVKTEGFDSESTELPLSANPPVGDQVLSFAPATEVYEEAKDFDEYPEGLITKGEMHFNSNGNYSRKDLEFFVNVLDEKRSSSVINEGVNLPSKKWFYVMYVIDTERKCSYVMFRDQKDLDGVKSQTVTLQNWNTSVLSSRENETQVVDGVTLPTTAATQTTSHKFRIGYNTFNGKDLGMTYGDVWALEELKIFNNVCSKNAMTQLFNSEFASYLGFYYQKDSVDFYINGIL